MIWLVKNYRLIGVGVIVLITGLYIWHLRSTISEYKEQVADLTYVNTMLKLSVDNLQSSLERQNVAILELNENLQSKEQALKVVSETLDALQSTKMQNLEQGYSKVKITDSRQAMQWLKNRRFSY